MKPEITIPPHDANAEKALIGSMLIDPDVIDQVRYLVSEDAFYLESHAIVYRTIVSMRDDGSKIDGITLADRLSSTGNLEVAGGQMYLLDLLEAVPFSAHALSYAAIVLDKAENRFLLHALRHAASKLDDPATNLDEMLAALNSKITTASENRMLRAKPKFRVFTSAELDASDISVEYFIPGILAKNQPCILAAPKKALKTTVATDLVLSVASGSKFLTQFYVSGAARVAFMSGESGDATIQETARRIAKTKPWVNLSDYQNAVWSFDLPRLGRPETKRDLTKFIGDQGLQLLIIDPAYLCLDIGDDAGNLFKVGPKLMELTEIMRDTGCTIVLIHHCKKANSQDPFAIPELENISWSGFQEWARQWILLNRRERYDAEQSGSHKLWMTAGGSAGHSGCWALDIEEGSRLDPMGRRWDVTVQTASEAIAERIEIRESESEERARVKAEKVVDKDSQKLLTQYQKYPNGETETFYVRKSVLTGTRGRAATEKLLSDGSIEPCKVRKKNGQEYDGFKLVVAHAESTGNHWESTRNIPGVPTDRPLTGNIPLKGIPSDGVSVTEGAMSDFYDEAFPVDFSENGEIR